MSLFDKITAQAPASPPAAPAQAAPQQPDTVDIRARDAFIAATAAVRSDAAAQLTIWNAFIGRGVNRLTLDKAIALLCRLTNADLDARYGNAEPEYKTAAQYAAESVHIKRQP